MKRLVFALVLASAPLAGCANLPTLGLVPASSSVPHADQTRKFLAAEDAIEGVTTLVDQALTSGVLKGDNARKAAQLLGTLKTLDSAAYAAYTGGDVAAGDNLTSSIMVVIAQITTLISLAKHGA